MKALKKIIALLVAIVLAFSCVAVSAVAAPTIKSIKITTAPMKTTYFKTRDWDYGYWKFTDGSGLAKFTSDNRWISFMYNGGYYSNLGDRGMVDMNGLVIEVTYTDGTKKNITYKETKSEYVISQNIYWGVSSELKVGENTIEVYLKENTKVCATYKINISEKTAVKGDVNEDLKVNSADALLALQHVVGLKTLAGTWFNTADLDSSGAVNSYDALMILKIAVDMA